MEQYHNLVRHVLENGEDVSDRTGVGTRSVFGYQMRFNLQEGFPAVTTKKLAWKAVVGELLWFLEGSTDERRLAELTFGKDKTEITEKKTIWTDNADNQGKSLGYTNNDFKKELGKIYGWQWRNFGSTRWIRDTFDFGEDQIKWLLKEMKENPDSRRLILSAWNPNQLELMALPPCHTLVQFRIYNGKLSCQLYQRSADIGLGIPFNIASYSLLTHIFARELDLDVGDFVHTIGDAHIYNDHIDSLKVMLEREHYPLPKLKIDKNFNLISGLGDGFPLNTRDFFVLDGYQSHDTIKMNMAV